MRIGIVTDVQRRVTRKSRAGVIRGSAHGCNQAASPACRGGGAARLVAVGRLTGGRSGAGLPGGGARAGRGGDRPGEGGVRGLPGAAPVPAVRPGDAPGPRGLGWHDRGGTAASRVPGTRTGTRAQPAGARAAAAPGPGAARTGGAGRRERRAEPGKPPAFGMTAVLIDKRALPGLPGGRVEDAAPEEGTRAAWSAKADGTARQRGRL